MPHSGKCTLTVRVVGSQLVVFVPNPEANPVVQHQWLSLEEMEQ